MGAYATPNVGHPGTSRMVRPGVGPHPSGNGQPQRSVVIRRSRPLACCRRVTGQVSFNAFVVSLARTAAVHFGDVADPVSGQKTTVNLEAAGHAIEMLSLLDEKTKGNLTNEEEQFLRRVLHELRMRYVEAKKRDR